MTKIHFADGLPQDRSIAGEKHMASLGFAVCAVIGPIAIRVPDETIAGVNADADADAIAGEE